MRLLREMGALVGGTITEVSIEDIYGVQTPSFIVTMPAKGAPSAKQYSVLVQSDAEGNNGGFLSIEQMEEL